MGPVDDVEAGGEGGGVVILEELALTLAARRRVSVRLRGPRVRRRAGRCAAGGRRWSSSRRWRRLASGCGLRVPTCGGGSGMRQGFVVWRSLRPSGVITRSVMASTIISTRTSFSTGSRCRMRSRRCCGVQVRRQARRMAEPKRVVRVANMACARSHRVGTACVVGGQVKGRIMYFVSKAEACAGVLKVRMRGSMRPGAGVGDRLVWNWRDWCGQVVEVVGVGVREVCAGSAGSGGVYERETPSVSRARARLPPPPVAWRLVEARGTGACLPHLQRKWGRWRAKRDGGGLSLGRCSRRVSLGSRRSEPTPRRSSSRGPSGSSC